MIRGSFADVICPKLPAFKLVTGSFNCTEFVTLNASALNSASALL